MTTILDVAATVKVARDYYIQRKDSFSKQMEQELAEDRKQFQRGYQHEKEIRQKFADKMEKVEAEGRKSIEDAVSALETQEKARLNSLDSESVKKALAELSSLENLPVSSGEFDVLYKKYADNSKYMLNYWPGKKLAQIGLKNGIRVDGLYADYDVKKAVLSEIMESVNTFYDAMKAGKEIPARLAVADAKLTEFTERYTNGFSDIVMDSEQTALTAIGLIRSRAVMDAGGAAESLLTVWKNAQSDESVKAAVLNELAIHPLDIHVVSICDSMGAMVGVEKLGKAIESFRGENEEMYAAVPGLIAELKSALVTDTETNGAMSPHVLEVIHANYNNKFFVNAVSSSRALMANERIQHCMETVSEMQ